MSGKAVLAAAHQRAIPYKVTSGGLTLRVRWLNRTVTIRGRTSNITGLGRNGLALQVTTTIWGAKLDIRSKVPHGWADSEVIERVALVMGRAKALLKLEKRKVKRRRRHGSDK
jgi:hypothetical protein